MKFTEKIALIWEGSPGAILCLASAVFATLRFFYLWDISDSLVLAWLDLFIIALVGLSQIPGYVLVYRQWVRFRARQKRAQPAFKMIEQWDEEICALSWELCKAVERGATTEDIEAINQRIDEAHQRRDREAAFLRNQS